MKDKKGKKRQAVNPVAVLIISIILVVAAAVAAVLLIKYTPTKKKADLKQVYGVTGTQVALIIDSEFTSAKGYLSQGQIYLPLDIVSNYFNDRFYWNGDEGRLLYTLPDETVGVLTGDTAFERGGNRKDYGVPIIDSSSGSTAILMEYVKEFTDFVYTYYQDPGRAFVDFGSRTAERATVKHKTQVRVLGGIKSEVMTTLESGAQVTVLREMENWSEVRTENGHIGYIRKNALENYRQEAAASGFVEPVYTSIQKGYDICLVWHQTFQQSDNDKLEELIGKTKGVTTVSPTWFSLSDNEGNFTTLADASYVQKVHDLGMEVWVLVDDFSPDMSVYQMLKKTDARNRLTENLINETKALGADGINIDFENITKDAGPHYIQFLRELSVACRREGLVLSVDNYVPSDGRIHYSLKEQGIVTDYVIIMGYDEHWKGSNAGSNASMNFVEKGIRDALELIPNEKLINAIPFFTRIWKEIPEEKAAEGAKIWEDSNSIYPRYALESEACGMKKPWTLLEEHGVEASWLVELGQYYGEYEEDGCIYRVWIEDARSIEQKMQLIRQQELAGVACWKLGLETEEVWEIIPGYLN